MKMGSSTFLKTGKIHLYMSPKMDAFLFKPSAAWKWIHATADFTLTSEIISTLTPVLKVNFHMFH